MSSLSKIKQDIHNFREQKPQQKNNVSFVSSIAVDEVQEQVDVVVSVATLAFCPSDDFAANDAEHYNNSSSSSSSFTFTLTPSDSYPREPTSYFCEENSECGVLNGNFEQICESLIQMANSLALKKLSSTEKSCGGTNVGSANNADDDENESQEYIFGSQQQSNDGDEALNYGGNNRPCRDARSAEQAINLILPNTKKPFQSFPQKVQAILLTAFGMNSDLCCDIASVYDLQFGNVNSASDDTQNKEPLCAGVTCLESLALGFRVVISFPIHDLLSEVSCHAYGILDRSLPVEIQLYFKRKHDYINSFDLPEVIVFQTVVVGTDPVLGEIKERRSFRFGTQLKNMLDSYFSQCWDRTSHEGFKYPQQPPVQVAPTSIGSSLDDNSLSDNNNKSNPFTISSFHEVYQKSQLDKFIPSYYSIEGFLCHVIRWIRHRIVTCVQYCIICDQYHTGIASTQNSLKPSVCERNLCVFQFQHLAIGKDEQGQNSINTGSGVLDLLVGFFRAAVFTSDRERRAAVLDPYPRVVGPDHKFVFDPDHKDFVFLEKITRELPSSKQLAGVDAAAALDKLFHGKHPACILLLQWIISSNRSYFTKLPQHLQLSKFIHTPHQFLLITASEEKQQKFEQLKKIEAAAAAVAAAAKNDNNNNNKNSTTTSSSSITSFGFHGSKAQNFHSILRNGLRNFSGTKLMSSGDAANAKSLYFAYDMQMSMNYARGTNSKPATTSLIVTSNSNNNNNNNKSNQPQHEVAYFDSTENIENNFFCVALCEVISSKIQPQSWCFTVADENAVLTRFLFVYQNHNDAVKDLALRVDNPAFIEAVRELIVRSTAGSQEK